jgi:hypothetical protein
MKRVFKYTLQELGQQSVRLPEHAKILCVKAQHNIPVIYAEIDDSVNFENYTTIRIFGTGHTIPDRLNLEYIDTILVMNEQLVWHIYKEVK